MLINNCTKELDQLYVTGKSKKYKLEKKCIEKYVKLIDQIEAAENIFDLRLPPSNNFEKLKGYENRFSLRLNKQMRLIFEIDFQNEEKTNGNVSILDISKHYE